MQRFNFYKWQKNVIFVFIHKKLKTMSKKKAITETENNEEVLIVRPENVEEQQLKPETENKGIEQLIEETQPETAPESEQTESEQPESEQPESEQPESEQPESEQPEMTAAEAMEIIEAMASQGYSPILQGVLSLGLKFAKCEDIQISNKNQRALSVLMQMYLKSMRESGDLTLTPTQAFLFGSFGIVLGTVLPNLKPKQKPIEVTKENFDIKEKTETRGRKKKNEDIN